MRHHKPKLPSPAEVCERWNRRHAIGQPVSAKDGAGNVVQGRTRTRATVVADRAPVIWLEGHTGGFRLADVQPIARLTDHA